MTKPRVSNILPTAQEKALGETLKRRVSQLTILYQMGREISENENWSDALDRFLMALVNYVKAEGAALLLFSEAEQRIATRATFQIELDALNSACKTLETHWKKNPRKTEIHSLESYADRIVVSCLERTEPWRSTLVPLRHRGRALGFVYVEKLYRSSQNFKADYQFLNTVQTILAGEVANASYISELRQLSRFNQKVLDTIESGVITTDLNGYVRFFNERAASLCPRLITGRDIHFDELFQSAEKMSASYEIVMKSRADTHVLDVSCFRSMEDYFPARLSITKMHDDNLNGPVLVAIFEDQTDQKRLETEVRRNDRLRVLGQLSAGVAHEIRNPLTGIATSAELLNGKLGKDDERTKYTQAILTETSRLDEIIRNLLNFARPPKPQISVCNLLPLSQHVVNMLSDQAKAKGVHLEIASHLQNETCRADSNQITQVLLNLVLNSIQACEKENKIEVVLKDDEQSPSGRGYARIEVIDDGPGIPREVRSSLFDPFVTTKTHGTGLGLAISQQIVEEHHGKIDCEFLSQGTRFVIRLPQDGGENPSTPS